MPVGTCTHIIISPYELIFSQLFSQNYARAAYPITIPGNSISYFPNFSNGSLETTTCLHWMVSDHPFVVQWLN